MPLETPSPSLNVNVKCGYVCVDETISYPTAPGFLLQFVHLGGCAEDKMQRVLLSPLLFGQLRQCGAIVSLRKYLT